MWGWHFIYWQFLPRQPSLHLLAHSKTSNLNIFWQCLITVYHQRLWDFIFLNYTCDVIMMLKTCFFALSGISTLLVVTARLRNPILCNRLFSHKVITTTFFTASSPVPLSKTTTVVAAIERLTQALTYEKQGRVIIARLIAKLGGYRRVKSCMPSAK